MRKYLLFCLLLLSGVFVNAQNDNCSGAVTLTVGSYFTTGAVTSTNVNATTDGAAPSCSSGAAENVWFKVVVPASGKLYIETREVSGSLFDDSVLTVYSGTCGSLTEIACNDDTTVSAFSQVSLTGQTPGATLYVSVWKYNSNTDNGDFQISAYDPVMVNDVCTDATQLTVGSTFATGMVTSHNFAATTDGSSPSCSSSASENVWFKVVVPASGKLFIETRETAGSLFDDSVLTVYSGTCGSLTEIACNDDNSAGTFSQVSLTGQTPGATLYVSVWKYDSYVDSGEFQVSAYDPVLVNDVCTDAVQLTVGADFTAGSTVSHNIGATTDGSAPSCSTDGAHNVWFKVTVPASGNLSLETRETAGSVFDDSVLTVYSGSCGSLTEIACDDDSGQGLFSSLSLTGQTPGATLYVSVWKYDSGVGSGEFQISAFDSSALSAVETSQSMNKIRVYPNPFADVVNISDVSDVQSLSVIDFSGRLIKTIEKPSSSVRLSDLKQGTYLITLKMNDGSVKTIKAIKK